MRMMRFHQITIAAALAAVSFLPAGAYAACTKPEKVAIPDAAKVTYEQLEETNKKLVAYKKAADAYRKCLADDDLAVQVEYKKMIDDYNAASAAFNKRANQ